MQVLAPIFDPFFSGSSFGFRPGRSARQAVRAARRAIADGLEWVADIDLDRFFDRVQFDVLMARVARKVGDRKVNREKSSIRHAAQAALLGFGFLLDGPQVRIRVAPEAIRRLKDQLRTLTKRSWGVSMDYRTGRLNRFITGWLDGLLPARGGRNDVPRPGPMAAPPPAAGPLEGMEDHRR